MSIYSSAKRLLSGRATREGESRYAAFISYSGDPDGKSVAVALRYGLHHLAKRWYKLRAMHVFLDAAVGMAAGAPLWEELRSALDTSNYFVLIASPVSAARHWVNREIAYWLENNPLETLIIVAAQGKIAWDTDDGDFDWSCTDALPQVLHGRYLEEPIFVDIREIARPLDRKDAKLNDKIADVAARLRGVTKEELTSRDLRERRRALRLAASAIVVLVIMLAAALVASVIAVGQRDEARAQARLALSRQLAADSGAVLPQSIDLAALLAVESYRIDPDLEARSALLGTLSRNPPLQRILRLPGSYSNVAADGTEVVVPGYRGASVWNVASGRQLGPAFGSGSRPASPAYPSDYRPQYEGVLSPDDRRLAVYTPGKTIELWDPVRHRLLSTVADPAAYSGGSSASFSSPQEPQLVYSPDGRYVLSTGWDAAYVFDAETLRMVAGPLRIPGGGTGIPDVDAAAFSPDGGLLALWNSGEEDFILSTRTWRAVGSITPSATTVDAAFSPNGRQLAVLSNFGAQLYDLTEKGAGQPPLVSGPVRTMNGPQNQYAVAWSHDGSLLASGGDDGTQIWNPATGKMLATLRVHPAGSRIDDVSGITFSRSGDHLFTSQADGVVTWQLNRADLDIEDQLSSIGPPVFGDGGRVIATADGTAGVQLWNATSGEPIGKPILPGGGTVQSVAFIADDKMIAVGEQTGTVIWNLQSNRPVGGSMTGFNHMVWGESASPDGRYVAAAEYLEVSVWDLVTRRIVLSIQAPANRKFTAMQAVISPDGNSVAMPAGDNVEIWSIPQRRETAVIAAGKPVNAVAFAPSGAFLAINTDMPATRLWDLRRNRWISLPMSNGIAASDSLNANPVAVNNNDALVASASGGSNSVTLWDSGSGAQIGVLDMPSAGSGDAGTVSGLAFSPDGHSLAVTTTSGTLTIWDLNVNDWLAKACGIAGRELTRSEWAQYIGTLAPYQDTCR